MAKQKKTLLFAVLAATLGCVSGSTTAVAQDGDLTAPEAIATDYLTFAAGALPLAVTGLGAERGADFPQAIDAIDGNPGGYSLHRRGAEADTETVFSYELPALTTFERFAVTNVLETPSPSQTFTRMVTVEGSATGPDDGFVTLASAELSVHESPGLETELAISNATPVRWVRVRLVGGIEDGATFFEFSEIIGNGAQEPAAMVDRFTGIWDATFGNIELKQDGAVVSGCADDGRKTVSGTVTGNLLRATFVDNSSGTTGAFIAGITPDGELRGVRSDNGAPFRLYAGPVASDGTTTPCSDAEEPTLGCGSVLHGINFDYDSATIRPDSEPVLQALFEGLRADESGSISIVGHTSSEGSDQYNQSLSERRAQSVVDNLAGRGLDAGRLSATGRGEAEPIANNGTETGRSLNRRVEVLCQ